MPAQKVDVQEIGQYPKIDPPCQLKGVTRHRRGFQAVTCGKEQEWNEHDHEIISDPVRY